ncbi:MLt-TeN (mlt-10) related [Caenorhabditis elegans]|uniref:MLt-TeN (Mlt-10) related n=1 Tax=Caenorhabditis elegans TaxID=6239 RepID=G4SC46_CAEEL|nr:MLt-TeN (mlt-10) related [Caenorhabditis elegans]CCD68913.1 MLt-TeN (mlt-10) related [Caenorhabditis elegans]|eukprot:NP_508765.2 MLt-TeN (mlt-10) related [Caenorhabditis elegans]
MDFVLLLVLLVGTVQVRGKVFDGRVDGQKIETDTKVFEIDKKKLQHYWQYATTMALIKAHTRANLENLPQIERIVFEECVGDSATVVAVAKCSVKVLDAKENAKLFTTTRSPPRLSFHNIPRPLIKQLYVSPSRKYVEKNYEIPPSSQKATSSNLYYSSVHHLWVQNPIRQQKQSRRFKRADDIMEAYDLFLEEQRNLKKSENALKKIIEDPVERNMFGLPRHMSMPRSKRSASEPVQEDDSKNTSGPVVDIPKLASKYFQRIVGGSTGQHDHLDNIRRIRNHYRRVEKCNGYFKLMNDENKKVFDQMKLKINSEAPKIDNENDAFQKIVDIINQFSASEIAQKKFSFLSPRILSIMPEGKPKNRFLSPTLLSFQKDGFFSLPDLFEIVSSNQRYQQLMLDAILDLSGAGTAMDNLIARIEPEMQFMEEVQYPMVQQLSKNDINWLKARQLFSSDQASEYKKYGFAHLNEEQVKLVYADNPTSYLPIANMTREERDTRIEDAIRKLATEGRPQWPFWNKPQKRVKRAGGGGDGDAHPVIPNYPEGEHIGDVEYLVLKPHAFANLINFGVSMEAMVLSPHAFVSEILRPEALKLDVLSPRAFIATVLSPSALIARILSPTAFRAEVLSPRALTAWVLSPEALIAEVLTPRFLEPRVLSPEALVIDVLSPGILAPHVLSSEAIGVMILSPNILSPRVASDEKFLVEVLSPHILGGPHSHEEEHSNIEIGSGSHEAHAHSATEHGAHNHSEHHQLHRSIFHHGAPTSIRSQAQVPHNPFLQR